MLVLTIEVPRSFPSMLLNIMIKISIVYPLKFKNGLNVNIYEVQRRNA